MILLIVLFYSASKSKVRATHYIEQAFFFSFSLKRLMFHNILNNEGKTLANEISQFLRIE